MATVDVELRLALGRGPCLSNTRSSIAFKSGTRVPNCHSSVCSLTTGGL